MNTIYKITKLGWVNKPYNPFSDYGDSKEFHIGGFTKAPIIGERFELIGYADERNMHGISTSPVTKIIDENTFETMNSVYRYEEFL
jgi:hypothetical protein